MKLRNKKTGKVFDVIVREKSNGDGEYSTIVCNLRSPGSARSVSPILGEYDSLAKLNEEWEDYTPAEPLIKDEKIRKAVRAWSEAEGIEEVAVMCHLVWGEKMTEIVRISNAKQEITFKGDLEIKTGNYTITELCGEEKE